MASIINTFNGGMDKDTSKQKYSNQKYVHARNLRPTTDEGLSTGALENVAGTLNSLSFPIIGNIWTITVIDEDRDTGGDLPAGTITFRIDNTQSIASIPTTTINYSGSDNLLEQIYNIIITKNNTLPEELQYTIGIQRGLNQIVIYNTIATISSISDSGEDESDPIRYDTTGITSDFIIIGSEALRDDIVIFTKNQQGAEGLGQIWLMNYNTAHPETTNEYSLKLIYNGALEFSLDHPIEAKARYENVNTIRVVWTDNFKPLRSVNIADPDTFALRPADFLLSPESTLSPAIVGRENQAEGNLLSGVWYTTYKLNKQGGGITPIAPFSSGVGVYFDDISVGVGGGSTEYHLTNWTETVVPTRKSLEFTVPNLPKGYTGITIYAIHEPEPGNFQVYLYKNGTLSDESEYIFTISDVSNKVPVPFSSLVNTDIDFERVKTLTVKDNTLLVANVKQAAFNIAFDARAYRFQKDSDGIVRDSTYTNPDFSNDSTWGIAENADIVNPLNRDKTIVTGSKYYRHQRNSEELGGTGPHISYSFLSRSVTLDNSTLADPVSDTTNGKHLNDRAPFVNQPAQDNIIEGINGTNVDIGPGFNNFKNTKLDAHRRGYMRDEVYRFGIVFYSLTGKPSEVKWIDDIRIPCAGDLGADSNGHHKWSIGQFTSRDNPDTLKGALIPGNSNKGVVGYSMGIQFDVDVSSIADQISGYSIVRVPRKEKDRTIIAEGILHATKYYNTGDLNYHADGPVINGNPADINVSSGYFKNDATGSEIASKLHIHDTISPVSDTFKESVEDGAILGDTLKAPRAEWRYGTLDCPDLKFITGAKMEGYEDKDRYADGQYFLKPVAMYSHCGETDQPNKRAAIKDGANDAEREDFYAKATVLRNNVSFHDRYTIANSWGHVKDIFYVDHAASNVAIGGRRFHNGGIVDFGEQSAWIPPLGPANQKFDMVANLEGLGVRTIAFAGGNSNITKYLFNYAGGKTNSTPEGSTGNLSRDFIGDPFNDEGTGGTSGNNDLHKWGYGSEVERIGHYAVVDICRDLDEQYGGATDSARRNSQYMTTGHFQSVGKKGGNFNSYIWGGDITVALWTEKKFFAKANPITSNFDELKPVAEGHIRGMIVPLQTITNTELRTLIHLNNFNSNVVSAVDIDIHRKNPDETLIPILYHKERNIQDYLGTGTNDLVAEYDNRVYMSGAKSNGETTDSWAQFDSLKFKDVDGEYGPINKLEVFNDTLLFFQDKAFGAIAFNPRSVVNDQYGTELTLGTGSGIVDFQYVSNTIGSYHQWSIVKGQHSIYFFDAHHKKFFSFSGKNTPLSDLKGMHSWFFNSIQGDVLNTDNPIQYKGVTAAYDQRFNEVIFTFHSNLPPIAPIIEIATDEPPVLIDYTGAYIRNSERRYDTVPTFFFGLNNTQRGEWEQYIADGAYIMVRLPRDIDVAGAEDGRYVRATIIDFVTSDGTYVQTGDNFGDTGSGVYLGAPEFDEWRDGLNWTDQTVENSGGNFTHSDSDLRVFMPSSIIPPEEIPVILETESHTIVFNEMLQAFTGFYDHYPRHYMTNGRRIFSQAPLGTDIYTHDEGDKGDFYENLYPSELELMVSPPGTHTKVFTNMEFLSQVTDNDGNNLVEDTLNSAIYSNEYQTTGLIQFNSGVNIKRRMRTWRTAIPRSGNARIRNPYMGVKLSYINADNKRLVLHDITNHYQDTPM